MREEKEIREALKRLKGEHLRRMRQPDSHSPPGLVIMVGTLEWFGVIKRGCQILRRGFRCAVLEVK